MINGKTLFIGDMLGEMQLVAIGRESATLVGGRRDQPPDIALT